MGQRRLVHRFGRTCAVACAFLGVSLVPPLALAQEPSPSSQEPAPPAQAEPPAGPQVIPIPSIASEAEALGVRVARARELAQPDPDFEDLIVQISAFSDEFTEHEKALEELLAEDPGLVVLTTTDERWRLEASHLEAWSQDLDERVDALERTRAELAAEQLRWDATLASARESGAPFQVIEAVQAASSPIRVAERALTARTGQLFQLQKGLTEVMARVREARAKLNEAVAAAQQKLFVREQAPLWDLLLGTGTLQGPEPAPDPEAERGIGAVVRGAFAAAGVSFRSYWSSERAPLGIVVICVLGALAGVFALRRRAGVWADDPARAASADLLRMRPVSMGVLIGLLVASVFVGSSPEPVRQVMGLFFLIPALRVLSALVPESSRGLLWALALFYVVDRIRAILVDFELTERLLLLLEVLAGLSLMISVVVLRWRGQGLFQRIGNPTLMTLATRLGVVVLAASAIANVFGVVDLARLLADGAFSAAYLGVALVGIHQLLVALWILFLRSDFGHTSRMARFHPLKMERLLSRGLGLVLTLVWVHVVLAFFSVRSSLYESLGEAFAAKAEIGDFQISLGGVVSFVVTVWAAWALSNVVRFVLEQEFFPRVALQRGVPYMLSTVFHYAVLLLGLYVALSVAGVDLSRVALVVGALSVGIGFGLQNVVNNFVSGLILLFERPVLVGDSVELGTMWGEVKRIGIRSSTLRTWDGAEVIVPNADLISNHVSNWTLSDRKRRMILPVGVAYGTDPLLVRDLLLEVVDELEGVLTTPKPMALFMGFGDSSLDFELRCWIENADDWMVKRSEANFAIHRKLHDAGVQIPFPQRDLHLRSVVASNPSEPGEIQDAGVVDPEESPN